MKTLAWYFTIVGLVVAVLLIRTTDWYKEFIDPETFWTEEVAVRTELLNNYKAEVSECAENLERLRHPDARDIWVKQKALERMSTAEAIADYNEHLRISVFFCDQWRDHMLPEASQDLETAKARLQEIER